MAYSQEHEKQEELKKMRAKAKERARQKAVRRMKQLERQTQDGAQGEGDDGRGSNLWAATIASTRIGLGVGISSRSDSGNGTPEGKELQPRPAGSPKPRDEVSPTTEQPTSNATSPWPLTPQDSMDEEMESKSHTVCVFMCACVCIFINNNYYRGVSLDQKWSF